jgi:hypothetical protein
VCQQKPKNKKLFEAVLLTLLANLVVPFGQVLAPWNCAALSGVESTIQRYSFLTTPPQKY